MAERAAGHEMTVVKMSWPDISGFVPLCSCRWMGPGCYFRESVDQEFALHVQREQARDALLAAYEGLAAYAQHRPDCSVGQWANPYAPRRMRTVLPCDCGYEAAHVAVVAARKEARGG